MKRVAALISGQTLLKMSSLVQHSKVWYLFLLYSDSGSVIRHFIDSAKLFNWVAADLAEIFTIQPSNNLKTPVKCAYVSDTVYPIT